MAGMKRKFALNYRVTPEKAGGTGKSSPVDEHPQTSGEQRTRRQAFLHDHRDRDALFEYLDRIQD